MPISLTTNTGVSFVSTARHDTYPAINPANANLAGKVVLITGASKGIGKNIALAFAQAGITGIALFARSNLHATEAACLAAQRPGHPLKVLSLSVDTTDSAKVTDAAEKVEAAFGRVDFIINNAGYMEPFRLIADTDPEEWWKTWTVNVLGTYHVTRAFLPLLVKCGGEKTVINMTSIGAHFLGPQVSAYQVRAR